MKQLIPACLLAAMVAMVLGCEPDPAAPLEPLFIASEIASVGSGTATSLSASGYASTYTFRDRTRRAFATPVGAPVSLEVRVPAAPSFRLAIAASTMGAPVLAAPVTFRVVADDVVVFEETIRRARPNRWHDRAVDLAAVAGDTVQLTFEASTGGNGDGDGILPLWGNPVIADRGFVPERPDIILISIDCLRADHVGAYGYARDTTPNLDAFASEAVLFERAMATSSYTLPTHASMLTGLLPSFHGAASGRRISAEVPYLPELLSGAGYRVDGLVSAPFLSSVYGFDRGFHTYRLMSGRASRLVDEAIGVLDGAEGQAQFLFFHLFEAHMPYTPPRAFRDRFRDRPGDITALIERVERRMPPPSGEELADIVGLYDGEIAYVDEELGRLFEHLRSLNRYERALIVVTADHGEAFQEHGRWEHARPWEAGPGLYEEVLHVPLIIKWPNAGTGRRLGEVVSQVDLFPSLLAAAGVESPEPSSAVDLAGAIPARARIAEYIPKAGTAAEPQIAVRRGHLKYLSGKAGTSEALYDLSEDPEESNDLAGTDHPELSAFRALVREHWERASRTAPASEDVTLDDALRRRLEALGYIER